MAFKMTDDAIPRRSPPAQQPVPAAPRLLSPTFHPRPSLGSNDDKLERAKARAARIAAVRRRRSAHPLPPSDDRQSFFDRNQIMELYRNCIKLASENKINQKNMWELDLIDHLSEIIRVESDEHNQTNFQKASCTLEAGVRIYSLRVDSVHTEAYKVLGVISWAGRGDNQEEVTKAEHTKGGQTGGITQEKSDMKLSPLSTLESSFEVLNLKKFDVAFAVDPLYHQMSGQFDEGGAKGLLLSNLGTYSGCRILFDSFEVPGKSMAYGTQNDKSELVDLSFFEESIGQMLTHMPAKNDISPTLMYIVNQFEEKNRRPSFYSLSTEETVFQVGVADNDHTKFECDANDYDEWSFDHDDHTHSSVIDDHNLQENDDCIFKGSDIDDGLGKVAGLFSVGFQLTSNSNAWAGPDHWKYQKTRGLDKTAVSVNGSELEIQVKNRKKDLPDICFTQSLDKTLDIFTCPKNPRSLLLPVNRSLCNTTLPEDCHYNPENLLRLFVLPNCMFLGKKGRESSGELGPSEESRQRAHTGHPVALSDSGSMISDPLNDGDDFSDGCDPGSLVHQPRQVNKVDIQYERVSKQVDVHALKEMLWSDIQDSVQIPEKGDDTRVSFKEVLRHLYNEVSVEDISPHLFLICLLHLANEHGLMITDFPSLDELDIHIPVSALVNHSSPHEYMIKPGGVSDALFDMDF